jgi:hypothetical protein
MFDGNGQPPMLIEAYTAESRHADGLQHQICPSKMKRTTERKRNEGNAPDKQTPEALARRLLTLANPVTDLGSFRKISVPPILHCLS